MNRRCGDLLVALTRPEAMLRFSPAHWDRIIPQARSAGLLGRLAALAEQAGLADRLPIRIWHALEAGLAFSDRQALAVHHELGKLDVTLARLGIPVLVLKGAAYLAGCMAPARGRLMSDIDILVAKAGIPEVEAALMRDGWISDHQDAYDHRYYREWMHELPPMRHVLRGTVLDVHHNLLPETARIKTRPDLVIAASVPLPDRDCLRIPCLPDLILHSATHLMHEGEWEHGLRDLADLHALIGTGIPAADEFWAILAERARSLGLERPLHYALRLLETFLELPRLPFSLPPPPPWTGALTYRLLASGVGSHHRDCRSPLTGPALFLLYVRSHWLRMPGHLLVPHLVHKALKGRKKEKEESA